MFLFSDVAGISGELGDARREFVVRRAPRARAAAARGAAIGARSTHRIGEGGSVVSRGDTMGTPLGSATFLIVFAAAVVRGDTVSSDDVR